MEWYASAMELSVWTESSVTKAEQNEQGLWTVTISKGGLDERILHPKHVVSFRPSGSTQAYTTGDGYFAVRCTHHSNRPRHE